MLKLNTKKEKGEYIYSLRSCFQKLFEMRSSRNKSPAEGKKKKRKEGNIILIVHFKKNPVEDYFEIFKISYLFHFYITFMIIGLKILSSNGERGGGGNYFWHKETTLKQHFERYRVVKSSNLSADHTHICSKILRFLDCILPASLAKLCIFVSQSLKGLMTPYSYHFPVSEETLIPSVFLLFFGKKNILVLCFKFK